MSAAAPVPLRSVEGEFQTESEQSQLSEPLNQEDTARIAYALWQSRGCPDGSPDEDWFAAEEKIRASYEISGGNQLPEKIGPSAEQGYLSPHTEAKRIA